MKEYATAISAAVTGIFVILAAIITWKLKAKSDAHERKLEKANEHRDELKSLFTRIFVSFEQIISKVLNSDEFSLEKEISEINAQVNLLAPPAVVEQYHKVAQLLQKWSALHFRATPRSMKVGDKSFMILQAPDPTAEFKVPASEAYDELQAALQRLIQMMRSELSRREK